ncbi:bifunctional glutamate--cysteine ligase GshA/glutathione synthetase GshB [Alkalibaculum bacchi]|uniref:bifunctional glutamate--cysteine ligase GshA/glutathione synthetase GshB n=1 Tax=Alkalibaculum bacchi TaxID=645887 RepID=UPI0026EF51DC|nr:bifunctional glutamate--cysteine ligase GshA/glutathione synthetase GshB [Alkalibaculum bacchi]
MMEVNIKGLELSTQIMIEESLRRGIHVEIIDQKENLIRLEKEGKVEYIQQATKTSADSYIVVLLMENKQVTKLLLKEQKMNVPHGVVIHSQEEALQAYNEFEGLEIVVKPNSTNFGQGVVILDENRKVEDFKKAVDYALALDSTVLIEEFFKGKEYRFLVIGDELAAVVHRVPANVVGDGKHTIEELVEIKNRNPLRGKGYVTPLEKIQLGVVEEDFLLKQNLTEKSILDKDVTVYLRENSNVSTGGDTIDYTDEMHPGYKDIAIKAAKALNAKICGIDIILKDYKEAPTEDNYCIIELNFNPALHMHNFPFEGKNRRVEEKVLDLLGF